MLSLNPGMLVWTWVTFVALAIVLWKLAWKPLLAAVESRENNISDAIKKAENAREEAEKLLTKQQEKLAEAQDEMQKVIKEAKQMADKTRNDMIEQAREDARERERRMLQLAHLSGRKEILSEKQHAINSVFTI